MSGLGGILGDGGSSQNDFLLSESTGGASVGQAQQPGIATEPLLGANDGAGPSTIPILGTDSLFNPFYIFRYSKFGSGTSAETTGNYSVARHKDTYINANGLLDSEKLQRQKEKTDIQNPTASKIIEYTNAQADRGSSHGGPLYPYPYSINDFLWCKWYGKMPNNRLLTLRRYPIPVEDNLAVAAEKLPLVPIAQAVTWWGGDTSNSIGDILGMTYGMTWEKAEAKMEDVDGNEISAADLTKGLGDGQLATLLQMAIGSNPNNPFQSSGYDETIKKFTKDSWEKGAYWNRVRGPVNVITESKYRNQGLDFNHTIKLTFEYNLRSFGNINPKVAMLDLISNFLSLTYNRASFWGGGYRYYQKTGYILPGFNTSALEQGDYVQALKDIIADSTSGALSQLENFKSVLDSLGNDLTSGGDAADKLKDVVDTVASQKLANDLIGSKLAKLHQNPLLLRALLDGRAVGEWHLMVGNPLDPLAVIGNLCLKTTKISFSDELGADDFPVSVKFEVDLEHGRPRAKQDIESMFNLGGGDLAFTALQPPSSAMNTFGDYNTIRMINAGAADPATQATARMTNSLAQTNPDAATNTADHFRVSVATKYGSGFANSPILSEYFTQLKTKD